MKDNIEAVAAYMVGLGAAFYGQVIAHSSDVMSLGGMVLLAARIYVDGTRAYRQWKGTDG